jgi:hypothetical protein
MIPDEWNTSERAIPNAPVEISGSVALLRDRHPDWAWQRPAAAIYEALQRARAFLWAYLRC